MKTQCQMIREHLEAGHRLSPIEALDKFGCFRLASRINELRKQGLDIRTDIVEGAENGKRWAEYWLHRDSSFLETPEPPRKTLTHSPDKDDAMALAMFATEVAKATVDKEQQAKPRRKRRKKANPIQIELF